MDIFQLESLCYTTLPSLALDSCLKTTGKFVCLSVCLSACLSVSRLARLSMSFFFSFRFPGIELQLIGNPELELFLEDHLRGVFFFVCACVHVHDRFFSLHISQDKSFHFPPGFFISFSLFFISGGVVFCANRHSELNLSSFPNYNPKKPREYISYTDGNNLVICILSSNVFFLF